MQNYSEKSSLVKTYHSSQILQMPIVIINGQFTLATFIDELKNRKNSSVISVNLIPLKTFKISKIIFEIYQTK